MILMSNAMMGAAYAVTEENENEVVLLEDALPPGSTPGTADAFTQDWIWVSDNPQPYSGSLAHQSIISQGIKQHYYTTSSLNYINVGDTFFVYVYLDPENQPIELMIQFNIDGVNGTWERRAYWGDNVIPFGVNGTNSKRYIGPLPPSGSWQRLEVPASVVGLETSLLGGLAFTRHSGRVTWDRAGFVGIS